MTDPHGRNKGTVKGTLLRGEHSLAEVEWDSGIKEFVHESELKEIENESI